MDTLPPYTIDVYNRAAQRKIGTYRSNQVPRAGEFIAYVGDRIAGDPYEGWGGWKVDEIMWCVAQAGSMTAHRHSGTAEASCTWVELHCWPAEGPWFTETPKWARAAVEPGYHDEDEVTP